MFELHNIVFTGAVVDYNVLASSTLTTTTTVRISTRRDNTLEFNETFAISIPSDLIHNTPAAEDCITKVDVLIIDDDCKLPRIACTFHEN